MITKDEYIVNNPAIMGVNPNQIISYDNMPQIISEPVLNMETRHIHPHEADHLLPQQPTQSPKKRKTGPKEVRPFWNMERLFNELGTKEQCMLFAEKRGLIPSTRLCNVHNKPMSIMRGGQVGLFRCNKGQCRNKAISRAQGTWFENVRLPLPLVFRLMYCFANDFPFKLAQKECSTHNRDVAISLTTICDWYRFCRKSLVMFSDKSVEYSWRKYVDKNNLDEFEELLECVCKIYKVS